MIKDNDDREFQPKTTEAGQNCRTRPKALDARLTKSEMRKRGCNHVTESRTRKTPQTGFSAASQPRFVCDMMLGRLSKWLRIFGYDTLYFREISDAALLRLAREQDRVLLTRDTKLTQRRPVRREQIEAVLIKDNSWRSQLSQLVAKLALRPQVVHFCAVCNHRLANIDRNSVERQVPAYVWQTQRSFQQCPHCSRIFWQATHWDNIEAIREEILRDHANAG